MLSAGAAVQDQQTVNSPTQPVREGGAIREVADGDESD